MVDVIEVVGGFIVRLSQGRSVEFVGKDGYWTRDPENASAFATRESAQKAASKYSGDR